MFQVTLTTNAYRKYYRMPGPDWEDSLPFDSYTKKLKITSKDTESCINGCYLLMTIKINEIGGYVSDSIFYPFSILVKVTPPNKAYTEIPKLVIQVDEYIVGTLDVTEMDERYISEFYEIWLPHDSDTVEFDWQSSLAGLYISIGGTRPTTKNADFVLTPSGRASLENFTYFLFSNATFETGVTLNNDGTFEYAYFDERIDSLNGFRNL
jgi:hypothetical protein